MMKARAGIQVLPKSLWKKLRNKSITKDELTDSTSNSSHSVNNMMMPYYDEAAISSDQDGTSNSMVSYEESTESINNLALVSPGSAKHDTGGCKPCLFVYTHVGCQNGQTCEFCHFPHKRKSKARPCKGKRDRYRKLLMRMENSLEQKEQGEDEDEEGSLDGGGYNHSGGSGDAPPCTTTSI